MIFDLKQSFGPWSQAEGRLLSHREIWYLTPLVFFRGKKKVNISLREWWWWWPLMLYGTLGCYYSCWYLALCSGGGWELWRSVLHCWERDYIAFLSIDLTSKLVHEFTHSQNNLSLVRKMKDVMQNGVSWCGGINIVRMGKWLWNCGKKRKYNLGI